MAASQTLPTSPKQWHTRVWSLTWPVILANVTIPLVGVADVAVMGRLPDAAYIAAVTMGAAMFSAVYWLFGFLRMGTTGLAAQAFGRTDLQEVVATGLRAGVIAVALGGSIVALQWPISWLLFALFDAPAEISALAERYYNIRIWGAPGLLISLVHLGILFGLQRMRDTLWLSVGMNVTNLTLDVVFVLGLGMTVEGVAYGTLISEWGAALLGLWLVKRALHQSGWQGPWPKVWIIERIQSLFHVSSNLILRTFFVQLPFFVGTVLATQLGATTLAVHGVLMQLFFVMTYSLDGFAHTAETLCGYAYGARRPAALRAATRYCAQWGLLLAAVTGCCYWLGGELIVSLLTTSIEIRESAGQYLPWLALAPLLCLFAFLYDGIFIGTTHIVEMRNAMLLSAGLWAAVVWFSLQPLGYHAVWLSMSVFMLVRSLLLWRYYPRIVHNASTA